MDVSLAQGLASVKLKAGNATTLKQLRDAIAKNGFTMKQSQATVAGTFQMSNGVARLMVTENLDAWSAYHLGLQHMYRFNRKDNASATALMLTALTQSAPPPTTAATATSH